MARAHWLSGGARRWLDDLAHAWWKRGMLARLRSNHRTSGNGREEALVADIESRTKQMRAKYLGDRAWMRGSTNAGEDASGGDDRDASHVSRACRVLATHQALSPYLTDHDKLVGLIREHEGAEALASSMLGTGVATAMMMTRDPLALAVRIVRALAYDHGDRGWAWRVVNDDASTRGESKRQRVSAAMSPDRFGRTYAPMSSPELEPGSAGHDDGDAVYAMETSRCLYHSLFAAEGAAGLAAATCCAVDGEPWFRKVPPRHGVSVRRTESLGAGDGRCVIRVERRE